ncbi:MAG: hypothetical protein ACOZAI_05045 [Pseudomonadota bacterium]
MSIDNVISALDRESDVSESYVLIREIKAFLDVEGFSPLIRIKIYQSSVHPDFPYHFDLSHYVHTPVQAAPYYPSRTMFETETVAISQAIRALTSFMESAISAGHEPSEDWLVPNEEF